MSNTVLTASIIASEAIMILENNLVMANRVFRGYEEDFAKKVNGYKVGESITIRKPTDFTVRETAVMSVQDVVEGSTTITIDKRRGVDFKFTSHDLTLKIGELSERVIKPAMVQLANRVDVDLMALYKDIPSWVGTPASPINSYADFAKGPERMDEYANPTDGRVAVLSPADHWGLLGSQTALYMQDVAKGAYRKGSLGEIGGVDTYMDQNVPTHTTGADMGGTVNQSITTSTVTYASVKDTNQQTITTSSVDFNAGDVFTIDDVYAVNPVSKAKLSFLKQFVVVSYASNSLVFSPAMIWTGAQQNVSVTAGVTDLNTKAITGVGTAATAYRQNMMFHRNAFALVMVPLVSPPGAVDVARKSHKGINVRVIPVYDGVNDESAWRLDVLYGTKTIDPRLAHRISGTT
jgi:hypothetical protein